MGDREAVLASSTFSSSLHLSLATSGGGLFPSPVEDGPDYREEWRPLCSVGQFLAPGGVGQRVLRVWTGCEQLGKEAVPWVLGLAWSLSGRN